MAPVETDSTQQTESPLDSRQFARLVEGLAPPSAMAEEPTAGPDTTPASPDLAARIADLQTQLQTIQARQSSAPAPSPADWSAASAQGTLAAFEQLRQRRMYEEQQQRAYQPPQMPPDEALLTDPNAIKYAINAQVEHALRSYDAAVRPQLQEAAGLRQLLGPLVQQATVAADAQARSLAEQDGLDAETFNRLLPDALRMIDSAPGEPDARWKMRMDPGILVTAVHAARRSHGGQITPAAPPTSIGVTHSPSAANGRGREVNSPGADMVEKMFGRKLFSPEQKRQLARSAALSDLVNAQLPEPLR